MIPRLSATEFLAAAMKALADAGQTPGRRRAARERTNDRQRGARRA